MDDRMHQLAEDLADAFPLTQDEAVARVGEAMAAAVRDLHALPSLVRHVGEAIRYVEMEPMRQHFAALD